MSSEHGVCIRCRWHFIYDLIVRTGWWDWYGSDMHFFMVFCCGRVDICCIVFKESAFVYCTIFINLILKSYSFVNTLD